MFVIYLKLSYTWTQTPSGSVCGAEAVEEKATSTSTSTSTTWWSTTRPSALHTQLPLTPPALQADRTRSSGNWVDLSRETLRRPRASIRSDEDSWWRWRRRSLDRWMTPQVTLPRIEMHHGSVRIYLQDGPPAAACEGYLSNPSDLLLIFITNVHRGIKPATQPLTRQDKQRSEQRLPSPSRFRTRQNPE